MKLTKPECPKKSGYLIRYYDADCGRYVSLDPIGLAGGSNSYQYAPNPSGWTDPLGLSKTCKCTGTNTIGDSATNPALASRLDTYKAWKADNGVAGTPTLKEFALFDDPSRVQSGFKAYSNKEWPPNSGALDGNTPFTLLPGAKIDRFGSDFGSYLSPTGTSYSERALRPGTQNSPYSVFEVTGPLDVEAATIKPWFGEIGMGTQYKLLGDTRVKNLLDSGQLKEVYRGPYNGYKQ